MKKKKYSLKRWVKFCIFILVVSITVSSVNFLFFNSTNTDSDYSSQSLTHSEAYIEPLSVSNAIESSGIDFEYSQTHTKENKTDYIDYNYDEYTVRIFYSVQNETISSVSISFEKDKFTANRETILKIIQSFNDTFGINTADVIFSEIEKILQKTNEVFALGDRYHLYDSLSNTTQLVVYNLQENLQIDYIKKSEMSLAEKLDILLVNSENPIPQNYDVNLVALGDVFISSEIESDLSNMLNDAAQQGVNLVINSAYRSFEDQSSLYNGKISEYINEGYSEEQAIKLTEEFVAKPGCSEHQTGMAVDFSLQGGQQFWLNENAHKYGFILRYPDDKYEITKINYEPWHYYYVGHELASYILESRIVLEEYVDVTVS